MSNILRLSPRPLSFGISGPACLNGSQSSERSSSNRQGPNAKVQVRRGGEHPDLYHSYRLRWNDKSAFPEENRHERMLGVKNVCELAAAEKRRYWKAFLALDSCAPCEPIVAIDSYTSSESGEERGKLGRTGEYGTSPVCSHSLYSPRWRECRKGRAQYRRSPYVSCLITERLSNQAI